MDFTEIISTFAMYLQRPGDYHIIQMCGLAEGTNPHTLKTQAAITYFLYNKEYSLAVTDNIAMTTCSEQAVSTFCYYLVSINALGTVTVTKGTDDTYSLPNTPFGNCPIGAIKINTDATHTFTSGTTDLSATGITAVLYDIDTGIASLMINNIIKKMERGITISFNGNLVTVGNWDHMKVKSTVTLTDGVATITNPILNYKELIEARVMDSNGYLYPPLVKEDYVPPGLPTIEGRPRKICRLPVVEATLTPDIISTQDFTLWPVPDTTYTLYITSYQYSPTLDGVIYSSNWWTNYAPGIVIKGALVEITPFLKEDERSSTWKTEFESDLVSLFYAQSQEKYAGHYLRIKPNNPFVSGKFRSDIYSFTGEH